MEIEISIYRSKLEFELPMPGVVLSNITISRDLITRHL